MLRCAETKPQYFHLKLAEASVLQTLVQELPVYKKTHSPGASFLESCLKSLSDSGKSPLRTIVDEREVDNLRAVRR